MRRGSRWAAALLLVAGAGAPAGAQVSLVGDRDCFALGVPCPDGPLWRDGLGGVFGFPSLYQGVGDPAFTDKWDVDANGSYNHTYLLPGPPTSASLEIRTAGLADNRGPWTVFFNGILVGAFPTSGTPSAFEEVVTHVFAINPLLLTGNDAVLLAINGPAVTDGFSIDYSELTVGVSAVPEPAKVALLAGGLAMLGVGALRRRRAP